MKRWLLILGIVIIVILFGIWIYLLVFGTPSKEYLFNAFNFDNNTEEGIIPFIEDILTPDPEPPVLRQLTMRRVIGYTEVSGDASSTPAVYFAEAGTGHVYSLNLETDEETRVSNITIPKATKAAVAEDGSMVAVINENGKLTVLSFKEDGSETTTQELNESVDSFSVTPGNTVLYSTKSAGSMTAREFDPRTNTSRTLFEVPFREAIIVWGKNATDTHFAYPKPAIELEGYVYSFSNGVMDRLPISGYGLSFMDNGERTIFLAYQGETYNTYSHIIRDGYTSRLQRTTQPEKCAIKTGGSEMVCGISQGISPVSWAKGETYYNDTLWLIGLDNQGDRELMNLEEESGRQIDVVNLTLVNDGIWLFFVNRIDQTLWLYSPKTEF